VIGAGTGWRLTAARRLAAAAGALGIAGLLLRPVPIHARPPSFDQVVARLSSPNAGDRLGALDLLREAGYPQAEVPVAPLLTDPVPEVRLAAIATEMNCMLAEKLVARSHVGLVVEVRHRVDAAAAFDKGLLALQPQPLPAPVASGLLAAAGDRQDDVALEAVYGLGVVGPLATGAARDRLWQQTEPRLLAMIASRAASTRRAGLRVLARLADRYGAAAPRGGQAVDDPVVAAMNDTDAGVRAAAEAALGALRSDRAVQALTERFHYYTRGPAAEAALDALARIAYPASLPLFESLTGARDPGIRAIAVEGIARLSDAAQVDALLRRLNAERSNRVNLALDFAVARTGRTASLGPFVTALASPALRGAAARDLLELTATGHAGAAAWQQALQTPDAAARLLAVRILGLAGDAALSRVLQPLAGTGDNTALAASARQAIARLQAVPAP